MGIRTASSVTQPEPSREWIVLICRDTSLRSRLVELSESRLNGSAYAVCVRTRRIEAVSPLQQGHPKSAFDLTLLSAAYHIFGRSRVCHVAEPIHEVFGATHVLRRFQVI